MNDQAKVDPAPRRGAAAALLAGVLLASCTLGPGARQEPASYDFGGPPAAAVTVKLTRPLLVFDVVVPAWLDTAEIHYRLAYSDATRPRAYANSRWVMPLSPLLSQRLRQQFAATSSAGVLAPADGLRTPHSLRVEIEDFTQVFDAPARSRVVLRARHAARQPHAGGAAQLQPGAAGGYGRCRRRRARVARRRGRADGAAHRLDRR